MKVTAAAKALDIHDKNSNSNKSTGSWLREKNETFARGKKGPDFSKIREFGQKYTYICLFTRIFE
jgi:hypothetical protein